MPRARGPQPSRPTTEWPETVDVHRMVGLNLRGLRGAEREDENEYITQEELAEEMRVLGFNWERRHVGKIESGARRLQIDELFGLAEVFERSPLELLYPHGAPAETDIQIGNQHYRADRLLDHFVFSLWTIQREEGRLRLATVHRPSPRDWQPPPDLADRQRARDFGDRVLEQFDRQRQVIDSLETHIRSMESTIEAMQQKFDEREGEDDGQY